MVTSYDFSSISIRQKFGLITGGVTPRPIAFVSTINKKGQVNLSPFSFFNAFGANPPILVFSPSRRVRDNTVKHTLENVKEVSECVIHIANYEMVEQLSLSSGDYAKGVNEFVKAGFTEISSIAVKPPRIKQAPIAFECKVNNIVETGKEGGAGNLVICEILHAHVSNDILDSDGKIDPIKMNPIARLGANYYAQINEKSLFEVAKPLAHPGIGFDNLPNSILQSKILTANNLGQLASVKEIPTKSLNPSTKSIEESHTLAKHLLDNGDIEKAWITLL